MADREAAYKHHPKDPSSQRDAISAFRHPASKAWRGFSTCTLVLGSVAAVIRYNAISRSPTARANRCVVLPPVGYFDDLAAMDREQHGPEALEDFTRFRALLCRPPPETR